jgi:hypothetical protein
VPLTTTTTTKEMPPNDDLGEADDIETPNDIETSKMSTDKTVSCKTRIFRFLFISLVIVVLVLTILSAIDNDGDKGTGGGKLVTPAPTHGTDSSPAPTTVDGVPTAPPASPPDATGSGKPVTPAPVTPAPTQGIDSSPAPTTSTVDGVPTAPPTSPPDTTQPPSPTDATITLQPTAPPTNFLTADFESTTQFVGQAARSRFGSSVALNSNGDLLAASGSSEDDAIQVFELENGIWQPHSTITVELSSSFSFASPDGIPVLAIASPTSFRVLQYISGAWTRRGQESLEWVAPDSTVELSVSLSAISISLDGSVVAAGSMSMDGVSIVIRIFVLNEALQLWEPRGDPIVRSGRVGTMSLVLSGDGNVVALEEYLLPQANVEVFEWSDNVWTNKGPEFSFTWGPAAVALSEDGQRLAVTTPLPGTGTSSIYQWETNAWVKTGKDIVPGGSSIALTKGGMRAMIGRPDSSHVWIHDYRNGVWVATSNPPLSGESESRFGDSISMSADGNTLAVGSPLDDSNGENSGRVFIYL